MLSKNNIKIISIGIPCFNEELNIFPTYSALKNITQTIHKYIFELIFVDNGSTDNTKDKIKSLVSKDKKVIGIFLSRNFGPEASGQAALDKASGDAFILMNCDLQDPPSVIPKFIKKWEEGYDSVIGVYNKLEDPWWMRLLRKSFYNVMKLISDVDIPINSSGFGLYSKRVTDAMKSLPEKFRFGRGIRAWVGFTTAYIRYKRIKRRLGHSSYSLISYFRHAERSVFGFSYLPLDLLIYSGLILVFCSFMFIIGYISFFFLFGNPIKESVTILVAIIFFGGINLLALSIIGKYIQVITEETKNRPTYIIDRIVHKTHE